MDNVYKVAAVKQVDFKNKPEKGRIEVNSWGEKQTNGLIEDVLPPGSVDSDTKLILANALYFKGEWNRAFDESRTRVCEFKLLNNAGAVQVPFMTDSKSQYINKYDDFKVLKLPYKQGNDCERKYSMYIILPNKTDGLPALVNGFSSNPKLKKSSTIQELLIVRYSSVSVRKFLVPKFKVSFKLKALKIVESLGFSGKGVTEMVHSDLEVSEIYHKAFFEVNEKGTVAAAVTAATLFKYGCAYAPPPPIEFVADHPFLYFIVEEVTGTVMFIGQMLNPIDQ